MSFDFDTTRDRLWSMTLAGDRRLVAIAATPEPHRTDDEKRMISAALAKVDHAVQGLAAISEGAPKTEAEAIQRGAQQIIDGRVLASGLQPRTVAQADMVPHRPPSPEGRGEWDYAMLSRSTCAVVRLWKGELITYEELRAASWWASEANWIFGRVRLSSMRYDDASSGQSVSGAAESEADFVFRKEVFDDATRAMSKDEARILDDVLRFGMSSGALGEMYYPKANRNQAASFIDLTIIYACRSLATFRDSERKKLKERASAC